MKNVHKHIQGCNLRKVKNCLDRGVHLNFKNYRAQRRTVDRLFLDLKKSFDEHEVSMKDVLRESTDRMILAVQQGKDLSTIQNCWEEIKEGIKTGGAAATIAATIARMLGLV